MDMRGRTVVVTGASNGLGLASSVALARAGADVVLAVSLRVNATKDDVIRAARCLEAKSTFDPGAIARRFEARFLSLIVAAVRELDFENLVSRRDDIADKVIGSDLDGYVVDGLHFRELAQTPLASLDPNDILNAVAIRKITKRTGTENARSNEIRQKRDVAEVVSALSTGTPKSANAQVASGYRDEIAAAEARVAAPGGTVGGGKQVPRRAPKMKGMFGTPAAGRILTRKVERWARAGRRARRSPTKERPWHSSSTCTRSRPLAGGTRCPL